MTTYRNTDQIIENLLNTDGTFATVAGETVPDRGYVVGLGEQYGLQLNIEDVRTGAGVADWFKIAQTRTGFVGSWFDNDRGVLCLDVVEIVSERGTAYNKAADRGEAAIYSLHNSEVIDIDPAKRYPSNV